MTFSEARLAMRGAGGLAFVFFPLTPALVVIGALALVLVCSTVLGFALLYFGVRLAFLNLSLASAPSKMRARHVLQATVIYLPMLFALMMSNSVRP